MHGRFASRHEDFTGRRPDHSRRWRQSDVSRQPLVLYITVTALGGCWRDIWTRKPYAKAAITIEGNSRNFSSASNSPKGRAVRLGVTGTYRCRFRVPKTAPHELDESCSSALAPRRGRGGGSRRSDCSASEACSSYAQSVFLSDLEDCDQQSIIPVRLLTKFSICFQHLLSLALM